jgi:hypothetical protein
VGLILRDEAFAQQQLDMAVITRAREHRSVTQVIDATVAHVGPPCRGLLHEANGAGRAWANLDRQAESDLDQFLVSASEREMQKTNGVEQRLRGMPEGIDDDLARDLGSARALGVASHSIHDDEQARVLTDGYGGAILVVLSIPEETHVGIFDLQEGARSSATL